ncbi:MAG: hypothetical protein OEX23_11000 [Betaproteobacteria bacterium]|nr:hypothetical protein [Betaproteobacteria bacterium]
MTPEIAALARTVQANCHVSDARHARDLTLCTYLLEMRELYRWERGLAPGGALVKGAVGAWLAEREALWAGLDERGYAVLPIGGSDVDPFDAETANAALAPQGYVYGAGVGRLGKPQFFLAELAGDERRGGVRILRAGSEIARDLAPAPAALRGDTVYLRHDALRRWIGGRLETHLHRPVDGPMRRALLAYGVGDDPVRGIDRIAAGEAETLVLHELGEHAASARLGAGWHDVLAAASGTRAEWPLRAARDLLADCLVTLPALAAREDPASLHFWFANFEGLREDLFPALADAYSAWLAGDDEAVAACASRGVPHWQAMCERAVELHSAQGAAGIAATEAEFAAATLR